MSKGGRERARERVTQESAPLFQGPFPPFFTDGGRREGWMTEGDSDDHGRDGQREEKKDE